ncbi:hypothetical protein HDV01_006376 [Terramyces sp. JEL0728]|nr:hypothetical protein HDV01_006376 [Terramyces sp. JEL0728]
MSMFLQGGEIDFKGQKLALQNTYILLTANVVVSALVGHFVQDMLFCMTTYAIGTVITFVVTILPLSIYNQNNIKFVESKNPPKKFEWKQILKKLI